MTGWLLIWNTWNRLPRALSHSTFGLALELSLQPCSGRPGFAAATQSYTQTTISYSLGPAGRLAKVSPFKLRGPLQSISIFRWSLKIQAWRSLLELCVTVVLNSPLPRQKKSWNRARLLAFLKSLASSWGNRIRGS